MKMVSGNMEIGRGPLAVVLPFATYSPTRSEGKKLGQLRHPLYSPAQENEGAGKIARLKDTFSDLNEICIFSKFLIVEIHKIFLGSSVTIELSIP